MSRSCVCGGSNENCRYCDGLGTIKDDLASALVTHAQRTDLGKDEKAYRVSNDIGGGSRSRRHVGKPRGEQELVPCQILGCLAKLRPDNVEMHLKKAHSIPHLAPFPQPAMEKVPQVQFQGRTRGALELVPCPISGCNARLKPTRVEGHMKKVHLRPILTKVANNQSRFARTTLKISNAKRVTNSSSKHTVVNPVSQANSRVSPFGQAPEKNLDATKGYAHAYRENGRFGSHPAHDGFDGEAGPD